jgi:hypothetical protein
MTYCRTLTDFQLKNVLYKEWSRSLRDELYYEAREECARRGIDPDLTLNEMHEERQAPKERRR